MRVSRVHMRTCERVGKCARISTLQRRCVLQMGADRQQLAVWNAFSFRKPARIADRLWPRQRSRIIGNYQKSIVNRIRAGKGGQGGTPGEAWKDNARESCESIACRGRALRKCRRSEADF